MAIRRLDRGSRFDKGDRSFASVSTLPTVKAMMDSFDRYLNLTIADGHASNDTVKTYRSRVHQFLSWCRERELYPALITKQNVLEYRKHLVDGEKTSPTIRLSLLAIKHFYTACLADKLVKHNPVVGVKAPREKREVGSTIKYLSLEELQQIFDSVAPTYKIRGDKTRQVQVLRVAKPCRRLIAFCWVVWHFKDVVVSKCIEQTWEMLANHTVNIISS